MDKVYEVPQAEEIQVQMEMNYLQSGEMPPIHGGDDPNELPSNGVES